MKILYITTIDLTINTFLVPHIERLLKNGNIVHIGCNVLSKIDNRLIKYGVKVHNIEFSRNPLNICNLKCIKKIRDIQKKEKYDIVHVHTPNASFITRYALKSENIKVIYTCHGFHFYKGSPIKNWLIYYPLEKIAGKWTDVLITINNEDFSVSKKIKLKSGGKRYLMNGVGIEEEKYSIDKFDRSEYRKSLGVRDGDFMILILAEINKNKNHIQVIKALRKIKDKDNIKVICAGEGNIKNYLEKKLDKYSLRKNIKFIGYRKDIKELLNASDCVALFSKREGLGKCLLEGLVTKKILVATNTRGARTVINNGENGFLVEIGKIKNTAEILKKVINGVSINNISYQKYLIQNVLRDIEVYHEECFSNEVKNEKDYALYNE